MSPSTITSPTAVDVHHDNGFHRKRSVKSNYAKPAPVPVIDLRGNTSQSNTDDNLKASIIKGLSTKNVEYHFGPQGPTLVRSVPTMVLYDDKGLEIFDKITYVEEYYLTEAEIDVLHSHAVDCVSRVAGNGSIFVELGCGAMRKTKHILQAIESLGLKNVTYYAVDLSEASLRDSLSPLADAFPTIQFVGLLGCYEDSIQYISTTIPATTSKTYLWLGSSIGNLNRQEAASFLRQICDKGMNVGDTFLCGIDRRNAPELVGAAYNDSQNVTRDFIMNGLDHVNTIFRANVFDRSAFEYLSIYNAVEGRHEAYYRSLKDQTISAPGHNQISLTKDEILNVEYSYKYSKEEVDELVEQAQFYNVGKYTDRRQMYDLHLFQKPPFFFKKSNETLTILPSMEEWGQMWKAWDHITTTMIPASERLTRPIALRHPFIFYLGHIPAFLDIQLARAEKAPLTSPQSFARIFERGIDPDLDDPSVCNPHSEVPDQWPEAEEIMEYQGRVRERLRKVMDDVAQGKDVGKRLKRALWMCYEHEGMHLETLLYMLVQCSTAVPPKGILAPIPNQFPSTKLADMIRVAHPQNVKTGINDQEYLDHEPTAALPVTFGWDVEKPARELPAGKPYEIQSRTVTIGEYIQFLDSEKDGWREETGLLPASWAPLPSSSTAQKGFLTTGLSTYGVKTVFGILPLSDFMTAPVSVSYNQAHKYATTRGMRLPTETELREFRSHGKHQPRNYGFASMVALGSSDIDSDKPVIDEGLWEWTSTVLNRSEEDGYVKSEVYPGYSSDFFDGKHNVVLGASWATIPRISERESFTNWYQRGYPYVFAGFRLARDL
ncbi:histidine-specific methyltransferase [Fimicolochytrium jonesii]|uniref:histidine-specific methyltransferase n=1 Tax=Fimicolochytrium jonesii TaxID=1396493 RepID=UPI0022FF3AF0|nr:histidine-specific methyltransferase [Fimicolochytrium jonesii]KAI8825009.1 histidine-specific methyltransferase [Fimicolochytrium jonesii]